MHTLEIFATCVVIALIFECIVLGIIWWAMNGKDGMR